MKLFMNIKEIEGLLCCYYSKRSTIQPVLIIFQPSNLKQILKKKHFLMLYWENVPSFLND